MGVDLLTNNDDYEVYAMADGVVVQIIDGFWAGTDAVLVKHGDLYVLYGEISYNDTIFVGATVSQGQVIGNTPRNTDSSNGNPAMLHLEVSTGGYRSGNIDPSFVQYLPALK